MANNTLISSEGVRSVLSMINPLIIKIVFAVIILLIGVVIGKVMEKMVYRILELAELDKITRKKFNVSVSKIISRTVFYFIIIFFLVLALNKIGITTALVSTIIVVLAAIIALFVLIGTSDIFANFFAGIVLLFRRRLKVGDVIRIKEKSRKVTGKIIEVNVLSVRVETGKDESVFIPNVLIFKSQVVKVRKHKK